MPDSHSFHRLLATEMRALRHFAMSLTRNDASAQDLVQDTLLKAWANRDRFEDGTRLRAWLFTILRNTFLSDRRKAVREVEDIDGQFAARLSVEPSQDHAVALSELFAAMQTLPASQRHVLMLVGGEGYSHDEAALAAGCAVGTVKSRINRARIRLAALLLSEDEAGLLAADAAPVTVPESHAGRRLALRSPMAARLPLAALAARPPVGLTVLAGATRPWPRATRPAAVVA
ncbi:sigma-70 family RNA polymerase sigma factor [Paracoccaceae bacterium Fryx2]|nr:sigma-70 family RNA polymerase sigma factor [Paracoccaceae bacterium Fryx2]